ncbi:uncharacterized protein LOC125686152 isoform X3 [Lagopus muta]|uniref:uncharacterized protein LOC125686152 isoform X1 n=1 Tax=Lagopus muta TaxID=64668 RepID=UPI0020A04354|nr:uncharacterized protein LOC125686152 isoform X1 [Lagopus muta]XP_048785825.1 uncharacterized protein LOC125686152 isoform X2 [Lagopus muta]XP_048785827.1 uncharacterized protein LOC125686152 isoform X3 [Lagopus muta]
MVLATRAHCWLMADLSSTRTPRFLSAELPSSSSSPNLYRCMELFLPRCKTLHLLLLNLIPFFVPSSQPVQVLLNGSTAFSQSSQLRIIGKLAEGGHYPLIKVIDEDVEQDRTQHRPLRNTAGYRPPTGFCTTNNDPLCSASQPVLNPPHCPLIYPTLPQLCYKDVVGDSIKCLAEIKVDYIHCSAPIHPARDNIIEAYQEMASSTAVPSPFQGQSSEVEMPRWQHLMAWFGPVP